MPRPARDRPRDQIDPARRPEGFDPPRRGAAPAGAAMGIYDREYYRDSTRGSGFLSGAAPTTKMLILINVGVFLGQWFGLITDDWFAASSRDIFVRGRVWELLTSPFLHDTHNLFHLVFNMLFLWFVGSEMESMYGQRDYLALYLTAAVLSTLAWASVDYFAFHGYGVCLGASGAVWTLVVLYALYYPRREIYVFFFPIEMWMLVLIYLANDLYHLMSEARAPRGFSVGNGGQGVAFASHLGGAAYGYLFKRFDLRWSRLIAARPLRPRLRIVSAEPRERAFPRPLPSADAPGPTPPGPSFPEEQLDARLDEVLIKIASQGREHLTDEEQRVLQEASRRARSRRNDPAR